MRVHARHRDKDRAIPRFYSIPGEHLCGMFAPWEQRRIQLGFTNRTPGHAVMGSISADFWSIWKMWFLSEILCRIGVIIVVIDFYVIEAHE